MFNLIEIIKNFLREYHIKKIRKFILKFKQRKKEYENILKEFGINLSDIINANLKDYYKILNISYTENEKEIRNAYIEMIKKYHPDVNKSNNSEELTKEINEAYSLLKDPNAKKDYDINYKKGNKLKLEVNTIHNISNNLIKNYYKLREEDFINTNNELRNATTKEEARAIIYNFADWEKRFYKAEENTFNHLFKYKKIFAKLYKQSKKFIGDKTYNDKTELNDINNKLENLINTNNNLNKAIKSVTNEIKNEIRKNEEKAKQILYSLI
ncbi:MAG: DnaJ domain-containing protein [Candidatus Micrarchaeia archaeon]